MKFPKRVPQHISETASFKLFASKIPDNWIIREVTERDYGIDCYLELVTDENELSGELALIQLKSRQSVQWTAKNDYTLSGIEISTSNYWFKFTIPVFIFLTDIDNHQLFFLSVQRYIRRNFQEFIKQEKFNYSLEKSHCFEGKDGIFSFKFDFYYEYSRPQFENEFLFFLSNLEHFQDFQSLHTNRDYHIGIENNELIYFEAMHRNYRFLCIYLNIKNPIPKLNQIKKKSYDIFKSDYYELHEHDLAELMEDFEKLTGEIVRGLKGFLHRELDYWVITNPTVYNYVKNIGDQGQLPYTY